MLKKIKTVGAMVACIAIVSSCTTVHTAVVTNNPVGSKTGNSNSRPFQKVQGVTYKDAMKNGGISKIGVSEFKMTYIVIGQIQDLVITGE